jgi:predicted regulator of Ras-like GTPase activity (Roadblock/LC7/MglB family)
MAMQGSLRDMDVATLIQHNCQDRKTAQLEVTKHGKMAALFFKEGNVVYATMDDFEGEEVIYQIVSWHEGSFSLELNVEPPDQNITRSRSSLLLEAARQLDESSQDLTDLSESSSPAEAPSHLHETLAEAMNQSADVQGAAVVGTDGIIYAAILPEHGLDETMVGAISAAIYGLGKRSVTQLKRGNFKQILIQGHDGYVIVTGLNADTLLVGLTRSSVNLGMAFSEIRDITSQLRAVL